jgi:CRP-like cAMP-binding protein
VRLTINIGEKLDRIEEVSTHSQGDLIGWSGLVAPYVYTLGAQAVEKASVIGIDAVAFRSMMESNPAVGYYVLRNLVGVIGERLVNLRVQLVSLTT